MLKRIAMLAVGSLSLVACGPGAKIDGKQGAAEALFAGSQQTKANSTSTPAGNSSNCPEGGNAAVSIAGFNISTGGGGASVGGTFKVKYTDCGVVRSDVGVAVFNGALEYTQNITTDTASANISQAFKGRVTVTGGYDDFLDVDVTQQVSAGDLGASGTGVSVVLKGTITTSDGTFTYDEAVNVTAGEISAKLTASR